MPHLRYRPDLDGLRATAVAGVLLFHAGLPAVGGGFAGVDVFFVISGYLITSLLFLELDRTGRIDFIDFWARRTRRILPSALLVIVATVAGAYLFASKLHFSYAARDAIYAALYIINWHQLAASIDYFNEEGGGLFLHYWSLAVEEQFYLFLTLVFALALGLWRAVSGKVVWTGAQIAAALLVILGILSFIANVVLTPQDQPEAFFGTHARIWELCLGSGVALLERGGWSPRLPFRSALAWLGTAAIVLTFLVYDAQKIAYPGLYALLPTLGAAFFLAAGVNQSGALPVPLRFSAAAVPVAIGKLSYALYLWHWPVFELYQDYFKSWTWRDRAVALAVTVLLSTASHVLVENPVRLSKWLGARPRQSLGAALAATLLVVVSAGYLEGRGGDRYIVLPSGAKFNPATIRDVRSRVVADNCHLSFKPVKYAKCVYANRDSARRIFLFGDSHALQWFSALEPVATKHGFALFPRTKSTCSVADVLVLNKKLGRAYRECDRWRARVLDEIERVKPEIVLIGAESYHVPMRGNERLTGEERHTVLAEAERRTIDRILATGAQVVAIADTPWLPQDPLECLMEKSPRTWLCRWPMSAVFSPWRFPSSFPHDQPPQGVTVLDLADQLCWDGFCHAANDNYVIMRDRNHITRTFSLSLSALLEQRLANVLKAATASAH